MARPDIDTLAAGQALPTREFRPDTIQLFLYNAALWNAHKIHFDYPYARDAEGYPGLVVHGPRIATLLIDHARREMPGLTPTRFSFRAEAPLIDGMPFDLCLAREGGGARLWARDANGRPTMRAEVTN